MRTGSEVRVGAITVLAIILMAAYVFYIRGYRAAADTYAAAYGHLDARTACSDSDGAAANGDGAAANGDGGTHGDPD